MMNRFEGKSVLVTGGNSGIGLATAQAFAREGARVAITGRDQATLDAAKATLGDNAIALRNDASDPAAAKSLVTALIAAGIKLDAIFLNAGIAKLGPIESVDEAVWDQVFNVNIKGPYFAIQALLPIINPNAAIVLNGSVNAHIGMPNSSVYTASKAALISLAKSLSSELLSRKVRVNVVSPGPVQTPLYDRPGFSSEKLSEVAAGLAALVPLKRFATPAEIAGAVTFLASADAAYIVGAELLVDGGMSEL
jgi:NAD(P)-dependent dehydrogenase (short-subunit alcohol dehydrogenase family)